MFFSGQLLSQTGNFMQILAQAWLVLELSGSALDLGLVTAVQFLPLLLLSPTAGVLVDGIDRRRLLLITQTLGLLDAALLGLLALTGTATVPVIFTLALFLGLVGAVESPARQVLVFDLVGSQLIGNAVSLNEVTINFARILGPAVGGILLTAWGPGPCFLVNALTYLVALWVLLVIHPQPELDRAPHPAAGLVEGGRRRRMAGALAAFLDGLRYVGGRPDLRGLLVLAGASAMIFNFGVALPVLAESGFRSGARGYGLMVAAFGAGALVGAGVAAADRAPGARRARVLALLTALLLLASVAMPTLGWELVLQAVTGTVSIWFVAIANAGLLLLSSPPMRGRVMGLWSMSLPGSTPVTGVLVGWITSVLGGRAGLAAVAVTLLLCVVLTWSGLGAQPPEPQRPADRGSEDRRTS
ncbi:MFS transporter [Nakamurella endophytica]|uniref:MFS transporter n=1 Tax=Nakamurella endophytica TaxID=1748367 RepID=A0A917SUY0_9ACTN|nr:MFS transporter [Nakamurella endophytica]